MDADARAERKARRKQRKAQRKEKKAQKKRARAESKAAAAQKAGRVKPPSELVALARCEDEELEALLRERFADAPGITVERLQLARELVRVAMAARPGDDAEARARLESVHATLARA